MTSNDASPELERSVARDVDNLCQSCVVIKVGIEPAMKAVAGPVKDMRSHPGVIQESAEQ